jgi:CMP-N-acetylneuraminic acid synthetase
VTDVERCLKLLEDEAIDSVATFKSAELNPERAWRIQDGIPSSFIPGANPWLPRQSLTAAYQLNGGVYAFRADRLSSDHRSILFGRSAAVTMPRERSVDIDDPLDLMVAEAMLQGGMLGEP